MPRDQVRATPRSSPLGALADFLAKSYSPERTQQMQGVAKFLDIPAISETLNLLSYGEPLTTGAGGLGGTTRFRPEVLDAAIAVAPGAGALGKLAAQGTMATGRAGARLAERVVPRIMERGGMGAEMLQGMSRGTVSPLDVYHGSPHKFDRFDASKIGTGEGAQAYGHGIYTAESKGVGAEYAKVLASPRNRVMDNLGVYIEPSPMGDGMWRLGKSSEIGRMIGTTGDATQGITDYQFPNVAAAVRYAKKNGFLSKNEKPLLTEIADERNYNPVRSASQMQDSTYNQLIASDPGNLYKVDLPDKKIARMLDWDKPLSEQPDFVKNTLINDMGIDDNWATVSGDSSGGALYNSMVKEYGSPEAVSAALMDQGIPGIKYLDEGSRGASGTGKWKLKFPSGEEKIYDFKPDDDVLKMMNATAEPHVTRNFVTFPGEEQSLTILERNGQPMVAPAVPEEQKMLQGFYRGYAGENLDTPELFVSPQKRIADYYADKRARQTGTEPHAEMVLLDPFAGETYGHSTMGSGAKAPMFTNAKKVNIEDIEGRTQLYQSGGVVKLLQNMLIKSGEKAITAAQRAEAGRAAAALIKSQEQVKASEALGQQMEKGMKRTTTTQADRTRVGGGNIGGAPFPALSQADPAYKGKVWGVMDEGTASRLKNLTTPETAWTTMLGSATQLKTNPVVFDKLKRQFLESMKQGNLSDELAEKINQNLSIKFGEGADIRDPGIWKLADTFDKRAALADAMMGQGVDPSKGGIALGGEKSGKGVIFRPTDTLIKETEPYLLPSEFGGDVPTFAAGPRLFSLEKESMYRPDLHPGFPTLIKGEDLGVNMAPTPTEVYLPDWHAKFKKDNPERKAPGYYDLALGVKGEGLPSQDLNDEYIRHLLREGFAEGGAVHMDEGGAAFGVFPQMKARRAKQDREAAANAPLSALRGWAAGTAGLPGDIEGLARMAMSQVPSQFLNALPALRAFGIGSRANPTPQLPTTEFYNEYLPGAQLNQTPTGKAFTTAGNVLGGTGSTTIAGLGAKSTAELANLAARIAAESPRAGSRAAQLGVVKMPGGNWLKGSVEDSVMDVKGRTLSPEDMAQAREAIKLSGNPEYTAGATRRLDEYDANLSLNNFIDKKIVPYIKNEMATPGDPLRAMAEKYAVDKPAKLAEVQARIDAFAAKMEQTARERGVPVGDLTSMRQQMIGLEKEKALVEARQALHTYNPEDALHGDWLPESVVSARKSAGFPEEGVGVSPVARAWENASDNFINVSPASRHIYPLTPSEISRGLESTVDTNSWLLKVPPETPVYYPEGFGMSRNVNDLGFDHLVDELRNATNPESGLPKNLLIDPADLSKLTMPKAVELVADINAWRATQKAEADLLRANNAATQVVKEYPEQGMKWVELKTPEAKLPEGAVFEEYNGMQRLFGPDGESLSIGATKEEAIKLYQRKEREKQLEDALKYEGDTMAHCVGGYCPDVVEGRSRIYSLRDDKGQPRVTIEVEPNSGWFTKADKIPDPSGQYETFHQLIDSNRGRGESYEAIATRLADKYGLKVDPKILQIKGKGNKKPADEFLPFVQDFVKSGKWSDVSDLKNSGLLRIGDKYVDENKYREVAGDLNPDYISNLINNRVKDLSRDDADIIRRLQEPEPGFAQGGMVSSNHFDPIKIKQIIASLDDDYDPQRIQQIIAHQESSYA